MKGEIKQLNGIDALYYFAQTNTDYDLFYIDLLDQIETAKAHLLQQERYKVSDIKLSIYNYTFNYLGNGEGYHWLEDDNRFYRIGFKDKYKNLTQHNVRVQLSAVGIYTIGIKSLLELINNTLLEEITTGEFPITRIDLNTFVQHDLSTLKKDSFVSRKRKYTEYVREIGNAHSLETLYIGKNPFLLRIYNKGLEMRKSDKEELMQEYFANHDFSLSEPIFNIEFEMHRQYLKYFNINTVEDAILNAENLFKEAMDNIRLVDLSTISEADIQNGNKRRAATEPLWHEIKEAYTIGEFLQVKTPLQRIERIQYKYTFEKAVDEHVELGRKAKLHGIDYGHHFLDEVHQKVLETFEPKQTEKQDYIEIEMDEATFRLKNDGELIKPVQQKPLTKMSDYELMNHYYKLNDQLKEGIPDQDLKNKILVTNQEMEKRGLLEIPL